jgi:hypothetical protein
VLAMTGVGDGHDANGNKKLDEFFAMIQESVTIFVKMFFS